MRVQRYRMPQEARASREECFAFLQTMRPSFEPGTIRCACPTTGTLDQAVLHDCPRLAIVLRGSVDWWVQEHDARRKYRFRPGDALLTSTYGWMTRGGFVSKDAQLFSLGFQSAFTRCLFSNYRLPTDPKFRQWWYHHPAPRPDTLAYLLKTLDALALRNTHTDMAPHLVRVLLHELELHLAILPPQSEASKSRQTWQLINEYLQENAQLPIDRNTTAQAFGIHPNHVSRLFRKYASCGFTESLNKIRLEKAGVLLREMPDATVAEVAQSCGFSCSSYFGKQFRRRYGCTPLDYRAKSLQET